MGGHTVDRIEYCNNSINRTMPFIWASNIVITSCENHKPWRKAQWSEGSDKTVKIPTLYWFHLFTHFAIDRNKFFCTHLPLYRGLIRNPSLSLPQILTPTTTTQWCREANPDDSLGTAKTWSACLYPVTPVNSQSRTQQIRPIKEGKTIQLCPRVFAVHINLMDKNDRFIHLQPANQPSYNSRRREIT